MVRRAMAVLTSLGVIDSFSEVIPGAADQFESYLKAIAGGVQEQGLPVRQGLENITASQGLFARVARRQCLAVIPNTKRLQAFKTLHYSTPVGVNLAVGWYLLGGEKAGGTQVGVLNFGGVNALEVADVQAIVQCVHQFAVMPAIYRIADSVKYERDRLTKKTGFFGA